MPFHEREKYVAKFCSEIHHRTWWMQTCGFTVTWFAPDGAPHSRGVESENHPLPSVQSPGAGEVIYSALAHLIPLRDSRSLCRAPCLRQLLCESINPRSALCKLAGITKLLRPTYLYVRPDCHEYRDRTIGLPTHFPQKKHADAKAATHTHSARSLCTPFWYTECALWILYMLTFLYMYPPTQADYSFVRMLLWPGFKKALYTV